MRLSLKLGFLALLVSACSNQNDGLQSSDMAQEPDIGPSAAPGVAFRYAYLYELPDEAISAVQEKHAAKCEALGVARCRITGLEYTVNESDAVAASLTVKLEPAIARQFGKESTKDVRDADGRLRSTDFTGEDTEPLTTGANRTRQDVETRIADIEKQLANATAEQERAQLQAQLNDLRTQLSQARATISGAATRLASTPMTFRYYGRGGISGFQGNPVRESVRLLVSSFVTMVTFLLKALAILLPWLLLAGLVFLIVRSRIGRSVREYFRGYGARE